MWNTAEKLMRKDIVIPVMPNIIDYLMKEDILVPAVEHH